MLKLRKIAVTGNLAAGKSTVCRILKNLGAHVLSSDKIAHTLLNSPAIRKDLEKLLGNVFFKNGKVDRSKIAKVVFNSKKKLMQLEKWLHPKILKKIEQKYQALKKKKQGQLFVVELPLLFETHLEKFFDLVIFVTAPVKICQSRFKKNNFLARKKRFWPASKKIKKADFVIKNNQDLDSLKKQTFKLYSYLTQKENI